MPFLIAIDEIEGLSLSLLSGKDFPVSHFPQY